MNLYGRSAVAAFNGSAFQVMLCTSAYVPAQDTHATTADITGEVVGTELTDDSDRRPEDDPDGC